MLFERWCYKITSEEKNYSILSASKPVTRRQATFLLKKKLNLRHSHIFHITPCQDLEER